MKTRLDSLTSSSAKKLLGHLVAATALATGIAVLLTVFVQRHKYDLPRQGETKPVVNWGPYEDVFAPLGGYKGHPDEARLDAFDPTTPPRVPVPGAPPKLIPNGTPGKVPGPDLPPFARHLMEGQR